MRKLILFGLIVMATTALAVGPAAADDDDATKTWRVTITNLTPPEPGAPGSQPLSPPLLVVHSRQAEVWGVGEIASHGVAAIAEDANNAPLESALPALPGVKTVLIGAGGPIPSGVTRSFTVETSGRFNQLSVVTMLVNTNHAFTGLDSLRLRGHGSSHETMAYDAGSEKNNELEITHPRTVLRQPVRARPRGCAHQPAWAQTAGWSSTSPVASASAGVGSVRAGLRRSAGSG